MNKLKPQVFPIAQFKPITTEPDLHVPRIIQWSPAHHGYIGECWCGRSFRSPKQTFESVQHDIVIHEDTAVIGDDLWTR